MDFNSARLIFSCVYSLDCWFSLWQLCSEYVGGWDGFLAGLIASNIESFEDLQPVLTVNEPQRALHHLCSIEGFQGYTFKSLISGFLQQNGFPLQNLNEDHLGLRDLSSRICYIDLSSQIEHPGFWSQLMYCCATASDSLLGGQNIIVWSIFIVHLQRF